MKTTLQSLYRFICGLSLVLLSVSGFAQTWTYDFGTGTGTANNANSGAGNTSFFPGTPVGGGTYRVKIGEAGGSLVLANPGTSLGTGTEAQLNASASDNFSPTDANKFGVYGWSSPSTKFYLKAKIRTGSTGNGKLVLSIGGSEVASTNTDQISNYSKSLVSIEINYDDSGAISSARRRTNNGFGNLVENPLADPLVWLFKKDTNQEIEIYANNSGSADTYEKDGNTHTLSTRTWDLWIDGIKVPSNNGQLRASNAFLANTSIDGFAFFATESNNPDDNLAYLYVDDLEYSNAFPAVVEPSTTWNGSIWSNNPPDIDTNAVIAGNYNTGTDGNFTAKKLTVNLGNILNIAANTAVTVLGVVANSGTITIQSDGNLVQSENFTNTGGKTTGNNTGAITVYREARMKRQDYTFWGSPVANRNLYAFSPATLTTRFYLYDESSDEFYNDVLDASSVFDPAIGYAVRSPNNYPTNGTIQTFAGTFTGIPNSGSINVYIDFWGEGYNLIANPYPSNINFQTLQSNNNSVIGNDAYFWTNINDYVNGEYIDNNYAVYNALSDMGNPASGGDDEPTKIIKVGQGFLVRSKNPYETRTLSFNNNIRTASNDGIFFNMKGTQNTIDRYWLRLTTPLNKFNTTTVVYKAGASNNYDDYDSPLPIVGSDSFYSIIDDQKLAIQGRYPFLLTDKISLGLIAYQQGNHTVTISKKEGIFNEGQPIYLYDKLNGSYTNLQNGGYTFNTAAGIDNTRFEVVYEISVLAADNIAKESVVVYRDGTAFVVKASKKIEEIQVFDMYGRLISVLNTNSKEVVFEAAHITRGTYILKVRTEEGGLYTKKIIR